MIVTILIIALILFVYISQIRRYDIKDDNETAYDEEDEREYAHKAEQERKRKERK